MKIRINDISADGLKVHDTISLNALNARIREGNDHGISFTTAPVVKITVTKTAYGAQTVGTVESKYTQPCGLCLKDLEHEVKLPANFTIKRKSDRARPDEEDDDEIGVVYFDGDHVDLEDIIQETLILSLSIYWRPERDKDGKCLRCGINFDEQNKEGGGKTTFGSLLKKAGIS